MDKQQDISIVIQSESLSLDRCFAFLQSRRAGAHALFIGTVREENRHKTVQQLEYSAYERMAASEIHAIIKDVCQQWDFERMAVYHRIGTLDIGDTAVIIGVSTVHRQAAFDICQYAINELKERVPIWKKEFYDDGMHWIGSTP